MSNQYLIELESVTTVYSICIFMLFFVLIHVRRKWHEQLLYISSARHFKIVTLYIGLLFRALSMRIMFLVLMLGVFEVYEDNDDPYMLQVFILQEIIFTVSYYNIVMLKVVCNDQN